MTRWTKPTAKPMNPITSDQLAATVSGLADKSLVGNGVANMLGQCGEGLIGESGDTLEGEFGAKGDCGDEMGDLLSPGGS